MKYVENVIFQLEFPEGAEMHHQCFLSMFKNSEWTPTPDIFGFVHEVDYLTMGARA